MAVTIGVNSWVTVAQADAYFATRLGGSAWSTLGDTGDDSKEAFLVTAFYWLLRDSTYDLSESADSEDVRFAQMEAAFFLLGHREEYEQREAAIAGGVKSVSSSKWSETLGEVSKPRAIHAALVRAGVSNLGGGLLDLEAICD